MAEIVSDVLIAGEEMVEMAGVSDVGVPGPLGPFVAGFAAELSRQRYKPQPVGKQLGLLAALSGWLAAEGVAVSGLSSEVAERFCAARRAAGHTDRATVRALDPLLGHLRALGVAPPASSPAPAGPVEELLARFRRYLEHERGLVPAAARGYVDKVRPFVERFDGADGLELWRVDVAEVRGFVVEVCPRLGRRAAQLTVVALRALLRFLQLEGVLERSLAGAVPSVAGWRLSGLPKRLEPGQVDALLTSCDRSTVIGIRDCAILTVLARLGLRAGEVAGLSLEDIDWRASELIVRGKGARSERLPLPHDVGDAIVGYLRDGRPATAQSRARSDPCAPAAAHRGVGDAAVRRDAPGSWPGVASPPRVDHRDLCQGRPRGAQADRATVAGSDPMSAFHDSLAEYLAVRRALGYRLEGTERLLGQFLDYLDANGTDGITVEHALVWATLPGRGQHWHAMRLGAVRGFARYLQEVDPRVEVPAADLLPDKSGRAVPYLYTDAQIGALIDAARTLRIADKTATFQTLFGLLAATGMRIGEAIALDRTEFDANVGTLTVRNAKFGKSRELPLHPTTTSALTRYLRRRDRPRPVGVTEALLLSSVGTRLWISDVQTCFRALRSRAGILPRSAACRPRLHDMRHSFAVNTLLDAYRTDGDPASRVAALSTYLGHVNPGKTYWYLHAAPELLELAGGRLERHLGGQR